MLRYLYGDSLQDYPILSASMFRDRADQFAKRLGWDVRVDANGEERDEYDLLNPLYVIWQRPDGTHGGSMRFLPTVERTMVNDCFPYLLGGGKIASPLIWECTRFCLNREGAGRTAAALMLAGGEIMKWFGVKHFVGVFDNRMVRIYRRIGACPEVLGSSGVGREKISVGLWEYSDEHMEQVRSSSGISEKDATKWMQQSLLAMGERNETKKLISNSDPVLLHSSASSDYAKTNESPISENICSPHAVDHAAA